MTNLHFEDFNPLWETCAKRSTGGSEKVILEQIARKQKGVFRYISQHECTTDDFSFTFIQEGKRSNFPERNTRIVQAGGYIPVQFQPHEKNAAEIKIIAFVRHGESELDFYRQQTFHHLNIYQAYFENCAYGYVLEFFLDEQDAPMLLDKLNARHGIEAALYHECDTSSHPRETSGSLL